MVVLSRYSLNPRVPLSPPSGRIRQRSTIKPRITQKTRERAVELYQSGMNIRAVGRELRVARSVVTDALSTAGVAIRPK